MSSVMISPKTLYAVIFFENGVTFISRVSILLNCTKYVCAVKLQSAEIRFVGYGLLTSQCLSYRRDLAKFSIAVAWLN
jgi:hypothetical protein